MSIKNLFKIAMNALLRNKLRAFLTMLGIIIGVASVIAMLGIGQGSKHQHSATDSRNGIKSGYCGPRITTERGSPVRSFNNAKSERD